MLNFKRVLKSTSAKENSNKKDQKDYMEKVKVLSNSCIKFVKYLKKINENTDFAEIEKAFKTSFKVPMSKSKMLSRTSRLLHGMDKELLKFKGKFNPEEVEEYSEIFRFKAKEADKNDYIKRSAIDDETIANTFYNEIPKILIGKRKELTEKEEIFNEFLGEFKKVQEVKKQSVNLANSITENINKLTSVIKGDKNIESSEKQSFISALESNKKSIAKTTGETESHMANVEKIVTPRKSNSSANSKDVVQKANKELIVVKTANQEMIQTINLSLEEIKSIFDQINFNPKPIRELDLAFKNLVELSANINPSIKPLINGSGNNKKLVALSAQNGGAGAIKPKLEELEKIQVEKKQALYIVDEAINLIKIVIKRIQHSEFTREEKIEKMANLSNFVKELLTYEHGMKTEIKKIEDNIKLIERAASDKNPQAAVSDVAKKLKPVNTPINQNFIDLISSLFKELENICGYIGFDYKPIRNLQLSFKNIFDNNKMFVNNQPKKYITNGGVNPKKVSTSLTSKGANSEIKNELEKIEKSRENTENVMEVANEFTKTIDQMVVNVKSQNLNADNSKRIISELGENKKQLQEVINKSGNQVARAKKIQEIPKSNIGEVNKNVINKELALTEKVNQDMIQTMNSSLQVMESISEQINIDPKVIRKAQLGFSNLVKLLANINSSMKPLKNISGNNKKPSGLPALNNINFNVEKKSDFENIKNYNKESISNIAIGNKIKELGDETFSGFSNLQTVTLGTNCSKIGARTFLGCTKLESINLENVAEIGTNAFYNCQSLITVNLSKIKNEKAIGTSAFSNCKALNSVILPQSRNDNDIPRIRAIRNKISEQVGNQVAKGINFVNDPDTNAGDTKGKQSTSPLFDGTTFTVRTEDDFEKMKDYEDKIQKIVVEGNVKKFKRTCGTLNNLVEVKLGRNCTAIKKESFYQHYKLTTINLENVQKIGKYAFSECQALKGDKSSTINLSKAAVIDEYAFLGCKNIKKVILGSNCKEIRCSTFSSCVGLTSINLESVKTIEDKAFFSCLNLNHLNLTNVTKIGNDAFWNCGKLIVDSYPTNDKAKVKIDAILEDKFITEDSKIELSKNEKKIIVSGKFDGEKLKSFKDNENIEEMVVQNIQRITLSDIPGNYKKTKFKKITLDKNCKVIDNGAFSDFKNLSEINLDNVRRIGSFSFSSTGLKTVDLKHIEQISSYAFNRCGQLTSVQLGTYLTKINKKTFSMCPLLSKINLGNIEKIGQEAFYGCSSLTEVNLENVKTLEQDAFKGCTSLNTVVLPNKNAKEIEEAIINQTGKSAGNGDDGTIKFINDPDGREKQ